jgi:hypothetical protein
LLTIKSPSPPHLLSLLGSSLTYLADNAEDSIYQLSTSEQFITGGWTILQRIIIHLLVESTDPWASKSVAKDIDSLLAWTNALKSTAAPKLPPKGSDIGDILPTADLLQDSFLRIEVLQAIARTADTIISTKPKSVPASSKDTLGKAKSIAVEAGKAINKAASEWKRSIKNQGTAMVSKLLAAGVTGDDVGDILELGGGTRVVSIQEVLDAAIDSVEGLEKVRVG